MTKASNERGEIPENYNDIKFIDPEDLIEFKESPELERALAAPDGSQEEPETSEEQPSSYESDEEGSVEEQTAPAQSEPVKPSAPAIIEPAKPVAAPQFNNVPLAEEVASDYALKRREDTRGTLALVYTVSTFIVFGLGMLIAVVDAVMRNVSIIDNLKEVLPLISGLFLSSLGFVLGYYFRKGEDK